MRELDLIDERDAAIARAEQAEAEIDAWKEASGLLVGGDPGGVEPRHLAAEMELHSRLFQRARDVLAALGETPGITLDALGAALLGDIDDLLDDTVHRSPATALLQEQVEGLQELAREHEKERNALRAELDTARTERDDWVTALRVDVGVWKGKAEQALARVRELETWWDGTDAVRRRAEQAEAQVKELTAKLEQAERERDELHNALVTHDRLADEVSANLRAAVDLGNKQLAEVEAQCAAMREALSCPCECGCQPSSPEIRAALAPDAGRGVQAELAALRATVAMVEAWTHEFGAALKPPGTDSYGEGMRDAKAQVGRLLEVTRG